MERETMTVEEAAQKLGIGRGTAYRAAQTGELPTIRLGKRLVVPREAIDRMLAEAPAVRAAPGDRSDLPMK